MREDPELPPPLPDPDRAAGDPGAPAPPPARPHGHRTGHLKSRVHLASMSGDGLPLGASLTPPVPAPLPDRRAPLFLLISLVAAVVAVTVLCLIASKL